MRKFILLSIPFFFFGKCVYAQGDRTLDNWSWGMGYGFHSNSMKFSNLDKEFYPSDKSMHSGVFSIFFQYELGEKKHFAIRPEFAFLHRGGKLTEIGKGYYDYDSRVSDVCYKLRSGYWDIRIPLIYRFGNTNAIFSPYAYIAPVFGLSTGGNIRMEEKYKDGSYSGYVIDLSKANMAAIYVAASVGLGVRYRFSLGGNSCFLGLEVGYEHGLTDTYGKKEKEGKASVNSNLFSASSKVEGTRKFSGFEIKMTLGVPFSVFKKKQMVPKQSNSIAEPLLPSVVPPVTEEKNCYTLEEIEDFIARGESVEGKTICAIDAIHFDFGKSVIKEESYKYLNKLASTFIKTGVWIKVKGHTDNIGSEDFNLKLSKERAEAVVRYLIGQGMDENKLSYSYYGMSKPLSDNKTEQGRTMNRRVEFEILK